MVYCAQRRDGSSRDKHWDSFSVKSDVVGVPVQLGLSALLVAGGEPVFYSFQAGRLWQELKQEKQCQGALRAIQ